MVKSWRNFAKKLETTKYDTLSYLCGNLIIHGFRQKNKTDARAEK